MNYGYKILSIELCKFTGMWLNDVELFKLDITKPYNLILGRNGCGKSRLIEQMSPLAASKHDFFDGGHKLFRFEFLGKVYCVKSERIKDNIRNTITCETTGEAISALANSQLHNSQVKQLFKYTPALHELLTGQLTLTGMRTGDRKHWFSLLSESDLSYALAFYQQARVRHRDLVGGVKLITASIAELKPRVLADAAELAALAERIQELQQSLAILDSKMAEVSGKITTSTTLEQSGDKITAIAKTILRTPIHYPESIAGMTQESVQYNLTKLDTTRQYLLADIEKLQTATEQTDRLKSVDLEQLELRSDWLESQMADTKERIQRFDWLLTHDIATLTNSYQLITNHVGGLNALIEILSSAVSLGYSLNAQPALESGAIKINELNQQIRKLEFDECAFTEQLRGVYDSRDVECPNCNTRFKPDEAKAKKLTAVLGEIDVKLKATKAELEEAITHHRTYTQISQQLVWIKSLVDNSPAPIQTFIKQLVADKLYLEVGAGGIFIHQFINELTNACNHVDARAKHADISSQIAIIKAAFQSDNTQLVLELDHKRRQLDDVLKQTQYWQQVSNAVTARFANLTKMTELDTVFESALAEREQVIDAAYSGAVLDWLREVHSAQWGLLISTKARYDEMRSNADKLSMLELQLADAQKQLAATNAIVSALSPESGLLAQHLYQCITRITDLMTSYISRIWGYGFAVLPCDIANGELDYQFPFWVDDISKTSRDVSKGSKGQMEVIDFSFLLTVYMALGLGGWPLFLDELGGRFDAGHKSAAVEFIKTLIDSGKHSQLIMISHDAASHYQLTHADVCVLDPNGVTLPAVYNQHVTMH